MEKNILNLMTGILTPVENFIFRCDGNSAESGLGRNSCVLYTNVMFGDNLMAIQVGMAMYLNPTLNLDVILGISLDFHHSIFA